ncbi:hypothetical protein ACLMNJ_14035 [Streptomyces seoulensis]
MNATVYGPVARTPQVVPTERRIPHPPRIWGAAHDDNTVLLGGIAGHAGGFSTPSDLVVYAQRLVTAYADGDEHGLDRGLSWIV